MILSKEALQMVTRPTEAEIVALLADDNLEFAPQVYSLKTGDRIFGFLEGHGPPTTFTQTDPFSKQEVTRVVDTWILRHPDSGYRLSILSSVQLDRKLPPFLPDTDGEECLVTIHRGEDQRTAKNFKVTDYTVAGKKRPDGRRRSWVQPKAIIEVEARESRTIDGMSSVPQLAAGAVPIAGGEDAQA